jgi:hypothetical protein
MRRTRAVVVAACVAAVGLAASSAAAAPSRLGRDRQTVESLFAEAERPHCPPADRLCSLARNSLATSAFELGIQAAGCTRVQAMQGDGCPAAAPLMARLEAADKAAEAAGGKASARMVFAPPLGAAAAGVASPDAAIVDAYIDAALAAVSRDPGCPAQAAVCVVGRLTLLVDADQLARNYRSCPGSRAGACERDDDARMARVDRATTRFMRRLLDAHGWLSGGAWGADTEDHAWLLVQHADADPAFQARVLASMQAAVVRGGASAVNLAYLTDRVLQARHQPQEYGTQGRCTAAHAWAPSPIRDPAGLDRRLAAIGMQSFEQYREQVKQTCQ